MKPALALLLCCLCAAAVRAGDRGWDGNYERLHFSIHWLFIPAGTAVIEARSPAPEQAAFRLEACSNPTVDLLYKVRDLIRVRSRITPAGLRPQRYRYRQHEGRHRSDLTLNFPEPGTVQMIDHLADTRLSYPVAPDTLDLVSAFFATRALALRPGRTYRLPVVDKDQHYRLSVEVLGRERLDTLLGENTPTVKIHPRLQSEGVFQRSGEMYIWLTDDNRQLPVRMESEVRFGRVISELTHIHRHAPKPPGPELFCRSTP